MNGDEQVVFVCTGNLCRSPMAEALLRRRLADRGFGHVLVGSAGTRALFTGATDEARAVVREMGARLDDHRARRADRGVLHGADLVVVMTGDHVIDVVHEAPEIAARVFKLSELARLVGERGPRRPGESLVAYAERLADGRPERPWAASYHDPDVTDPMGETVDVYRSIAREIDAYLETIVPEVWPDPG